MKREIITLTVVAIAAVLLSCFDDDNPVGPFGSKEAKIYVVAAEFGSSGILKWMNVKDSTFETGSLEIYQDSKLINYGGFLYIIERFGVLLRSKYLKSFLLIA